MAGIISTSSQYVLLMCLCQPIFDYVLCDGTHRVVMIPNGQQSEWEHIKVDTHETTSTSSDTTANEMGESSPKR